MLATCFNPKCKKELRYLRTGRVVRISRKRSGKEVVEHFWLCGECYLVHDFHFANDGTISMIDRSAPDASAGIDLFINELATEDLEMTA